MSRKSSKLFVGMDVQTLLERLGRIRNRLSVQSSLAF